MLTKIQPFLRWCWYTSAAGLLMIPALARVGMWSGPNLEFDRGHWIHFLIFVLVGALPLLAWPRRTGLFFSFLTAAFAFGLEGIRARPVLQLAMVNLLGVIGGILLGANLRFATRPTPGPPIARFEPPRQ